MLLFLFAAFGHAAIWAAIINRMHATGWHHHISNRLTLVFFAVMLFVPPALAIWLWQVGPLEMLPWSDWNSPLGRQWTAMLFKVYVVLCWIAGARAIVLWMIRHGWMGRPQSLRYHRSRSVTSRESLPITDDHPQHFLVHLPGNEILAVDLTERAIELEHLPAALDGLSIVHLSDFHFTGKVPKPFFEEVCRLSNSLNPDLVIVTGDLVDHNHCMPWVDDTFAKLTSRHGIYYVLGNHDLRCDTKKLKELLTDIGMIYVGGQTRVIEVRGEKILLAGNECPWISPAADVSHCPPRSEVPFRMFLSHSPDQLAWAQAAQCDLLFAGHTHGGQIRLPWIGPIFAPSKLGVSYASGLFHVGPTIMNVSRGISGELPLRMNCAPEMIHLTLHAAKK